MTPMEIVTDRDRSRWCLHAARALVEIQETAHVADMPPIIWQVTGLGVIGTVPNSTDGARMLIQFRAWVELLDLVVGQSTTTEGLVRHVRAGTQYRTRHTPRSHRVNVTIRASFADWPEAPVPPAS